ncbi:MAG: endonuclease/exonuclease/phosphatase family protein [Treponema sp.]|jgi:endonuclease/exonuclease/phosphatase family metal-dependent hydrolase|nr:endonuclease/exonuclease/phosphatase family protein [Treponema sp.]
MAAKNRTASAGTGTKTAKAKKNIKNIKSASSKKPSKLMPALTVIIVILALYYIWQHYGDAIADAVGIDMPDAPVQDTTQTAPPPDGIAAPPGDSEAGKIRVYSFNIQIFGASKMKKTRVVDVLVDIISHVDAVAVQEVRSARDEPVQEFMGLLPSKYDYVLGPREGRTASKEQYWVIYDTEKLIAADSATYDDAADRFQRSPMAVYFQTKDNFDFILIDTHIQPSDADKEITVLPEVVAYFQNRWNETDVLVMGDFNADGSYYNEDKLAAVFPDSDYRIIITNEYNTTVAERDNTYDRVIITRSAQEDFTGTFGVVYYDTIYDFPSLGIEPKDVSDHFPVWAEFYIDRDTD